MHLPISDLDLARLDASGWAGRAATSRESKDQSRFRETAENRHPTELTNEKSFGIGKDWNGHVWLKMTLLKPFICFELFCLSMNPLKEVEELCCDVFYTKHHKFILTGTKNPPRLKKTTYYIQHMWNPFCQRKYKKHTCIHIQSIKTALTWDWKEESILFILPDIDKQIDSWNYNFNWISHFLK